MTMATFSSWNSIKKAHHVDFVAWLILAFSVYAILLSNLLSIYRNDKLIHEPHLGNLRISTS
jgi:hypothetical protein